MANEPRCNATDRTYTELTCDRERGHAGDHRAYFAEHDVVLFWPYERTHIVGCLCAECEHHRDLDARDPRDGKRVE